MPKDSFNRKAPLVDAEELVEIIVDEIVSEDLKQQADSIWLLGSFVNPEKELDRKGRSDLDVFVVVPDWEYPQVDTGVAIFADQATVPELIAELADNGEYLALKGPEGRWERPPAEIWDTIPEYARRTLINSASNVFFRNEDEKASNKIRLYDVTIGSPPQLEFDRKKGQQAGQENVPGVCIWEDGNLVGW